jgi:ELWxxDGT repeat protein
MYELWSYDGTNAPSMVLNLNAQSGGSSGSNPYFMHDFLGDLVFSANGYNAQGTELWAYSPEEEEARLLVDILPGTVSSSPAELIVFDGNLVFRASGAGDNGAELWTYNGTTASLWFDINPGSGSSTPNFLCVLNDTLFFTADDGTNGIQIYWLPAGPG